MTFCQWTIGFAWRGRRRWWYRCIAGLFLSIAMSWGLAPSSLGADSFPTHASGQIQPTAVDSGFLVRVSETGRISVSVDGSATNDPSGAQIGVKKPNSDATVRRAWLACAGLQYREIADGDVLLDGAPVEWMTSGDVYSSGHDVEHNDENAQAENFENDTDQNADDAERADAHDADEGVREGGDEYVRAASLFFQNVLADVTSLVQPKVDVAAPGWIEFTQKEADSETIDGCALYVVFDDLQQAAARTFALLFGNAGENEQIAVRMVNPPRDDAVVELGLAISYSYQGGVEVDPHLCGEASAQYTAVDVNGQRLTSCAGNADDGDSYEGQLLTVGGSRDSVANPTDPMQHAMDGSAERTTDDELYDLAPFWGEDESHLLIETHHPAQDDNLFAAHLLLPDVGIMGEGILLAPPETTAALRTRAVFTATVQDDLGKPVAGRPITLTVASGPHAGTQAMATSDAQGRARFDYIGEATGADAISAAYRADSGAVRVSNAVHYVWQDEPLQLTLAPDAVVQKPGQSHQVTVHVEDAHGHVAPDLAVAFQVTGTHTAADELVTDDAGSTTFSYVGDVGGTDTITAWLDFNANGVVDVGEPAASVRVEWEPVTAIQLLSFAVEPSFATSALIWQTAVEIDNAGFNIYRATAPEGPYTRLNTSLIAARGNGTGAAYQFVDEHFPLPTDQGASGRLYYVLEDVDYHGVATQHGPVSASVPWGMAHHRLFLPHLAQSRD